MSGKSQDDYYKAKATWVFVLINVLSGFDGKPIDPELTQETKQLYDILYKLARDPDHFLFGHHQTTQSGVSGGFPPYQLINHKGFEAWQFTDSMVDNGDADILSDIKLVSGYYPAFVGFEFFQLDPEWLKIQRYLTQKAHSHGMIIAMSWHLNNIATGGTAWDVRGHKILRNLLPGGKLNKIYNSYLDIVASYANNLYDSNGRLIPFVLRLFHESNGAWFWWGLNNTVNNTGEDIQAAHRYVVHYLRDIRNVHNILYATSPNAGFANLTAAGTLPAYMATYPGDDFVDILGYDDYQNVRSTRTLQRFVDCLAEVVLYSESKDKIPALTEVGLNLFNEIDLIPDWWNDYILNSIKGIKYVKKNPATRRIAYVLTWANSCSSAKNCNYYTPWLGHPGQKYFYNFTQDPMVVLIGKLGYNFSLPFINPRGHF
ncbi:mannan endo-1,4-beta-mannosidase isoform X2 [Patella vulgata]|uniref:mannan endo-1,4-beta-mannosidase isoform X2 n=1 Tax=Patella vulgata TaxID=6465 RepID=UPI002180146D|nr:mannan endo-1,4-beta-mannosidase isoform X2 [Patella vulgata]